MKIVAFAVVMIAFIAGRNVANGETIESRSTKSLIASLGEGASIKELQELAANKYSAIPLLIGELKVLLPVKIPVNSQSSFKEAVHVVWCLRALRYLTGKDFRASDANSDLGEGRQFLLKEDGKVAFFAVWMSRDLIYLAPQNIQAGIIEQWRQWLMQDFGKAELSSNDAIDFWYF